MPPDGVAPKPETVPIPDPEVVALRAEVCDLRAEIQACHDILDGTGIERIVIPAHGTASDANLRLPARMVQWLLRHQCPRSQA